MGLEFLYKGLLLGFSVAAPVGPIGILCTNRTLNKNFISGFVSGLGAATADLIYGLIAGLGLTIISNFLIEQKMWIQLMGLIFLICLGIRIILKKEKDLELSTSAGLGLTKDYFSALFLTITNPITILFFVAVFAGLGLSNSMNESSSVIQLILGVFLGSSAWWLFLRLLTHKLKKRIGKNILRKIDLASGLLILSFGILLSINMINEIILP